MDHPEGDISKLLASNDVLSKFLDKGFEKEFFLVDLKNGEQKWFSNQVWASLGYDPIEISDVDKTQIKILNGEDFKLFIEKAKTEFGESAPYCIYALRFRHKNGKIFWWKCKGLPVVNEAGAENFMVVTYTDVTKEKLNETKALSENKRLKQVIFGLGDLVIVVDKSYIISEYYQNRDNELLFTSPSLFLNKHLNEIGLSDSHLRQFIIAINESKSEIVIPKIEFSLPIDGKVEYYAGSVSSVKDEEGQLVETIFIANNITEKKLAEVKLQELSLVGLKTTDLTILTDPFCKITWVNNAFEDHTGYKLNEVVGKIPGTFLHGPETNPETIALVDIALKSRKSVQDTMVNYAKDGRKYWVDFRIDPVFDDVGMCSHFISIERDVTSRKLAEYELATTRAYLLETNRVGKVGGWSYDVAKDKVYWTDVTREIHELPEDFEPTVEKVIGFYKEGESRNKYFEVGTNAIQNGVPYDVELQIVTAKGNEVWVRAIGKVEFKDGLCTRLYGTFQNIDSFKKVEIDLVSSSVLLKNLTDHVPGCVYQYRLMDDGSFSLPYISNGIFNLAEITSEEAREKPSLVFEAIHPEDFVRVQTAIADSYTKVEKWKCDYRIITPSKKEKWIRGISNPQRLENGMVWYGFLQEITADQVQI